jgi:hypothetical protein
MKTLYIIYSKKFLNALNMPREKEDCIGEFNLLMVKHDKAIGKVFFDKGKFIRSEPEGITNVIDRK